MTILVGVINLCTLSPTVAEAHRARALAEHPHKITMHVVSRGSEGMDGRMYQDLVERRWFSS